MLKVVYRGKIGPTGKDGKRESDVLLPPAIGDVVVFEYGNGSYATLRTRRFRVAATQHRVKEHGTSYFLVDLQEESSPHRKTLVEVIESKYNPANWLPKKSLAV